MRQREYLNSVTDLISHRMDSKYNGIWIVSAQRQPVISAKGNSRKTSNCSCMMIEEKSEYHCPFCVLTDQLNELAYAWSFLLN